MKFDVFNWCEVNTHEEIEVGKGRLQLRASSPCALYVSAHGVEALAGYASEWTLDFSEAVTVRIECAEGVRAFRYCPTPSSVSVAASEVFTNADRLPYESGMLAEVTRARRMLELERRQMMAEMRADHARMKASIRKAQAEAAESEQQLDQGEAQRSPSRVQDDVVEAEGAD